MARTIQIRVSGEVHRKLTLRAAREGISPSQLMAREAGRLANQPTPADMRKRLLSRPRVTLTVSPHG